jgi:hypothetical protein
MCKKGHFVVVRSANLCTWSGDVTLPLGCLIWPRVLAPRDEDRWIMMSSGCRVEGVAKRRDVKWSWGLHSDCFFYQIEHLSILFSSTVLLQYIHK